jgi:protein-tyrosine phosphatase
MQENLSMAKKTVEAGITHLFSTSHHLNKRYVNVKGNIIDCVFELNECLQQKNIPLSVHPGQELRIHRELFVSLEKGQVLTLDNTDIIYC